MLIQLNNICKTYNEGKSNSVCALNGISLSIKEKEMVALMGPSGSGKSTLLKIIGCLMTPTSGEYIFDSLKIDGSDDRQLAKLRNEHIGFVFQDFCLLDDRTAEENIMLPLLFSKCRFREMNKLVDTVLKRLNIEELRRRKISELSGGQAQRVAIARALVNEPKLILADEPTGALDSKTSENVVSIFRELNSEGTTVVIVTHNEAVAKCCDKTYFIKDGMVKYNAP